MTRVNASFPFLFLLLLLLPGFGQPANADSIQYFSDRQSFEVSVGNGLVTVGFDEIEAPMPAPFSEGGITIERGWVRSESVGQLHEYWFPNGSPPNFVDTEAMVLGPPEEEAGFMPVKIDANSFALGFLYRCFACDFAPGESEIFLHFYDRFGNPLSFFRTPIDLTDGEKFLGFRTSFQFAEVRVGVRDIDGEGAGNWFLDDMAYAVDDLFSDGFESG